jgi:glycosyltransferase involved in cell wall biosynthesis
VRILLLVDCYLPSTKSSAKLIHDLAQEIRIQGHAPIVVAPDDSLAGDVSVREDGGVTIVRVRTGRIKGASLPVRAIHEARLSSVIWKRARSFFESHPCDLVAYYSPSIFFGALVLRLKRLWDCPAYLILRDIFPQWALDAGVLRRGPAYWFFRRKELLQYDAADVIGVQSPGNLEYFKSGKGGGPRTLEVLFNWTVPMAPHATGAERSRLGLEGKTVFFYGGNIGVAQDMDNLLRLAERLGDEPGAHFLFVGDGSEVERLRRVTNERRLDNVTFHPGVDQERYLTMVAEFDVGLLSLDRKLATQNFPGKMLSYMQASLPILASVNPGNDLRQVVEGAGAGLVTWNGEDDQLAANARRLARDADLRRRMGLEARRLLEQTFLVSRAAEQLLAHARRRP